MAAGMRKPRALVVDDEPDIRELLAITLGRMNIDVESAGDYASAIKRLASEVYDLVLTDMRLLCHRAIPSDAETALTNCTQRGGNASFGAESRYHFVRRWGHLFFDADLTKAGTQSTGPRSNA